MRKLLSTPRLVILIMTFVVFMSIYVAALYKLQIIEGAKYYAKSQNSITTEKVVPAARGNLLDRYGRVLVNGQNFTEYSTILINDEPYPTAFISGTQIIAVVPRTTAVDTIAVAQFATDGTELGRVTWEETE